VAIVGWVLLVLGGLVALGNWLCLVASAQSKRHVSMVPFIGGVLAFPGAALVPSIGWKWALLAFVGDPSCLLLVVYVLGVGLARVLDAGEPAE